MVDLARHAAAVFSRLGQPASLIPAAGGPPVSGRVILNAPGAVLFDGAVIADTHSAQYPVADFPDVRVGDRLTVGNAEYAVRNPPLSSASGLDAVALLELP
jgi:hypothetical protein